MSQLTSMALLVLQDQLGSISSNQLRASGVTDRQRRRLLDDGILEPVGHFVYQIKGTPVSLPTRLISLCLQHPQGFVTGPTAGGYLGLRRMPKASKVHFCMPHGARFDCPNFVHLRQSTALSEDHIRQLDNGIRIATFERLAFDLAQDLTPTNLSSVIEQMLQRNLTTIEGLGAMARLLCTSRRRGSATFARVLLQRHPGAAAESHPELLVLDCLFRGGVDWQVERVTALDLLDLPGTIRELTELYRRRHDTITGQTRVSATPVVAETLANGAAA